MHEEQDALIALFRQLSDGAEDVFWVSDPETGRVLFLSRSYEQLWGRPCETIYAQPKSFLDSIHPDDRARIASAHRLQTQGLYDEAYRLVRPDGSVRWVHAKAYPIRNAQGVVTTICGIAQDITAVKEAEAAANTRQQQLEAGIAEHSEHLERHRRALHLAERNLSESEERYRQVVEHVGQGMVVVVEGRFVFANPRAQEITGYTLDEMRQFDAFDAIIHPDDRDAVRNRHRQRLAGEAVDPTYEFRILDKSGNLRWLEIGGTLISWDGQPATLTFFSDITARKRLEAELKATLAERETTLQHSIVGIAFLTANGRLRWGNDALFRIFGVKPDGQTGQSLERFYPTRDRYLEIGAQVADAVLHGRMFETELMMRRDDGTLFWAYLSGKAVNPHDLAQGTVWVVMDISQRRELEIRLQHKTAEQEVILETSQIGIAHTANRIHQWVNRTFCEMVGFTRDELILHSSRCHFPDDDSFRRLGDEAYPVMATGRSYSCETQMMRKNGEIFWVHMHGKNIDPQDPARGAIWTVMDITPRRRMEEQLKATSSEREAILQSALVGITFSVNRVHRWVNRAFATMMGYEPEELIGQQSRVHYPDDESWAALGTEAYPLLAAGSTFEAEWRMRRRDGTLFWVQLYGCSVEPGQPEKGTIWTFLDISARKQAEEDTLRALEKQKELNDLKSRFVSMTSHEFRTPLATILSSAELLKHYSDRLPDEEKAEILTSIETSVKRMAQMLDNVLLIGKAEAQMLTCRPEPLDVRSLCTSCAEEARTTVRSERAPELRVEIGADIATGVFDEKLLRHVLGNLLSNALKYSPNGGTVSFTVRRGDGLTEFEVADQGIGIPKKDLPRLFETFHRAENVGNIQGTGLGLAIVRKAVELHGGTIAVDSEEGRGTRFLVSIPDYGGAHA